MSDLRISVITQEGSNQIVQERLVDREDLEEYGVDYVIEVWIRPMLVEACEQLGIEET